MECISVYTEITNYPHRFPRLLNRSPAKESSSMTTFIRYPPYEFSRGELVKAISNASACHYGTHRASSAMLQDRSGFAP